jgi:hypothetical protein
MLVGVTGYVGLVDIVVLVGFVRARWGLLDLLGILLLVGLVAEIVIGEGVGARGERGTSEREEVRWSIGVRSIWILTTNSNRLTPPSLSTQTIPKYPGSRLRRWSHVVRAITPRW